MTEIKYSKEINEFIDEAHDPAMEREEWMDDGDWEMYIEKTSEFFSVFRAPEYMQIMSNQIQTAAQTNKMALSKSDSIKWLLAHCVMYSIPFMIIDLRWGVVNMMLHFLVDYFSSKITKYFWQNDRRHAFFVVLGLDQALHFTCLFLTAGWMELLKV